MSPEKQRIAIAEACGLKNARVLPHSNPPQVWADNPTHPPHESPRVQVPNYLSDLNAMHEAEETLANSGQRGEYALALSKVITGVDDFIQWPAVMATAAQRAEAFLRTIGKWEGQAMNKQANCRKYG